MRNEVAENGERETQSAWYCMQYTLTAIVPLNRLVVCRSFGLSAGSQIIKGKVKIISTLRKAR